jgi:hypothetical protein
MIEADELTKTYGRRRVVDQLTFRILPAGLALRWPRPKGQ